MGNSVYIKAQTQAVEAGMQYDSRYDHWLSPRGKFEGEQWWAPYFWDAVLNGDGETFYLQEDVTQDISGDLFHVTAEEAEAFDMRPGSWVLVRCDSQGFVMVTNHATREEAKNKFDLWLGA